MVSIDGSLRIIDFGMSRYVEVFEKAMTDGVIT